MSENWQAADDSMKTPNLSVSDPQTHTYHRPTHALLTLLLSMLIGQQCDRETFGKGEESMTVRGECRFTSDQGCRKELS